MRLFSATGMLVLAVALLAPCRVLAGTSTRVAVVAGRNDAGADLSELRYAEQDARRLTDLLGELGRFRQENIQLVTPATPESMLQAVQRATQQLAGTGPASLLLVFYSGHADGEYLLMGEEKLAISRLQQSIASSGATVTLLVLDACRAGAAARIKGGRSAPSFLRIEQLPRTRGRVVLTSATASELSQEADDIRGSFFTHYLLSGLRGEADESGDRLVTLQELYDYVYARTVERTSGTLAGTQHPSFLYQLAGEGRLVLSDLNLESTGLVLPAGRPGNYLLLERSSRQVLAEIAKPAGAARLVPLAPGRYQVRKRLADHLLVGDVEIRPGERVALVEEDLVRREFDDPRAKGWQLEDAPAAVAVMALGAWTAFSRAPAGGVWSYPAAGVGLRAPGWPARWAEGEIALLAGGWNHSLAAPGGELPFRLLYLGGFAALRAVLRYGPFSTAAGGKLLLSMLQRRFSDAGLRASDEVFGLGAAGSGRAAVRLGRVRLSLEIEGGLQVVPGAERTVCPYLAANLAVLAVF